MSNYVAPLRDMEFVLNEIADLAGVAALPGCEEASSDLVSAVLEEAAKVAENILAPLNRQGDVQGSRLQDDGVITPDGWKEAYQTFIDGGWNSLAFSEEQGGQGLPWLVATAVQEMWHAANMSFGLCPLLTQGAIEAVERHGDDSLRQTYLPKMVSGEWTGTMNLTEPQAGSDLSAVRTKAVPEGDHYRLFGQKIFITYGDHDLTDNIIHLVLARLPDAPEGVKGISLFVVPKYLVDANGTPGARNDVRTVSLEHKLGIHASPTCVLSFGDGDGAIGYLVGEQHQGLAYMFTMMNLARHAVGVEGLAIAERAFQQARAYARERVQGVPIGESGGGRAAIDHHPDVMRMLMTMKCLTEAMRALAYLWSSAYDKAARDPDPEERQRQQQFVELLTPVVKGWCTETGNEVASLGVQVHGGMGYVEETGAAQHFRDARITTIYEGTTGIQANDLVGRKLLRDHGAAARGIIAMMRDIEGGLGSLAEIGDAYKAGVTHLEESTAWLLEDGARDPRVAAAASFYYLKLWGCVTGGWLLAKSALAAQQKIESGDGDQAFLEAKIATANFYATHVLTQTEGLAASIRLGSRNVLALEPERY